MTWGGGGGGGWGGGVHANSGITTKKIMFWFFTWDTSNTTTGMLTKAKLLPGWPKVRVALTSLYSPSSKDNNTEYACAYCRKTLKLCRGIYITFESNPASLQQCCLRRWIWSGECWWGGRCSGHPWRAMFNSLHESICDGHVWNHLRVKGFPEKSFHLLLYYIK